MRVEFDKAWRGCVLTLDLALTRLASAIVIALIAAALIPLAFRIGHAGIDLDASVIRVLRFTIFQATISTLLSVIPAIFMARALVSRDFPGRSFLLSLFGVPLALPAIVVVLAIAQVYGSTGVFGGAFPLYGLSGILLAHVFFNLPLATRLLVQSYHSIPQESLRLAQQLGLKGWSHFRIVEWPRLRSTFLHAAFLIFMLCGASFVIVLTLGGGPQNATLEVAIYQALRMDFDLARALALSLVQIILCLVLVFALARFAQPIVALQSFKNTQHIQLPTWKGDWLVIVLGILLVLPPLLSILNAGLSSLLIDARLMKATAKSLSIGAASSLLATTLALGLGQSPRTYPIAMLGLLVPPAVIATGWFIATLPLDLGVPGVATLVILLNALMALPFAHGALATALARHRAETQRLVKQLGLGGWDKIKHIDWPLLRPPIMQAALMAMVLSLGDLTAVLLLGNNGIETLPALLHAQMGNYRGALADGTALVLSVLGFALTLLAQRIGETR